MIAGGYGVPLKASLGQLSVARSEIEKGSKRPDGVLLIAPDDKRRLHDRRRELILRALFRGPRSVGLVIFSIAKSCASKRRQRGARPRLSRSTRAERNPQVDRDRLSRGRQWLESCDAAYCRMAS